MQLAFLRKHRLALHVFHGLDEVLARGGDYWHTAIVFSRSARPSDRWFTSLPRKGVCFDRIGPVAAYDLLDVPIDDEMERRLLEWAENRVGLRYDWLGMLGWGHTKGHWDCTPICCALLKQACFFEELDPHKQRASMFYELAVKEFSKECVT